MIIGLPETCPEQLPLVSPNYIHAVERGGHEVRILTYTLEREACATQMEGLDAVLFVGGGDIAAKWFGAEPSPYAKAPNERRDAFEFLVLEQAVEKRLPVFGICRGLQLINIFFGGTIYQDLPKEYPTQEPPYNHPLINHSRPDAEWEGVHDIEIATTSRLYQVLQTVTATVNSTHHQAIAKLGNTLSVSARSADGVIEAIESDSYPIAAVQFHPERLAYGEDTLFTKLFSKMIELCNLPTAESEYERYRRLQIEQFEDDITDGRCYPEMPEGQFVRSK